MDNVTLSIRKTHGYVDSYSHLDQWEHLGTVKLTPPKQTAEGNGIDHRGTYVRFTRLPAGMDPAKAQRALVDTFSQWECHHEYDCCGCTLVRATAELVKRRTVKLTLDVSANY